MRLASCWRSSTPGETELALLMTPPEANRHHDALGNLITYQYDAASRTVLRIDGRGPPTSYLYDAASRLTGQQYQDGTRATMTYDANSQRTVLSDWTGSTRRLMTPTDA